MPTTKPDTDTGWSKEFPPAGTYWLRSVCNPANAVVVVVLGNYIKFTSGASERFSPKAGYEFLGPISPPDFEQLLRLRDWKESAMTLLSRYDTIAETFGGKLGSSKLDNLELGVERLRKAAGDALEWIEADYDDVAMDGSKVVTALREALANTGEQS